MAIIICTYNGAPRLRRFLPRLVEGAGGAPFVAEIVVVDDGSTDGTAHVVAELAPSVKVVGHPSNEGLNTARNSGVAGTSAEYLLFCDDDLELPQPAIAAVWAARDSSACLVPEVRGVGGELQNAPLARWRHLDIKLGLVPQPVDEVAYAVGACFLAPRALIAHVGGFDTDMRRCYGFDDTVFGLSVWRAGYRIRMIRGAIATHHQHGTDGSEARMRRIRRDLYRNRWVFIAKSFGGWRRWAMLALGLPRTCIQCVRERSTEPVRGYGSALWRLTGVDLGRPPGSMSDAKLLRRLPGAAAESASR